MKKFIAESWLVLVLGTGFAVALAGAQAGFGPRISANRQADLEKAIYEVVPGAAQFDKLDASGSEVFKCVDAAGQHCGWALQAKGFGFQDEIVLVVGLSVDTLRITGLQVLSQKETPGLGNKIEESKWRDQFKGMDATKTGKAVKTVSKDATCEVHAVTGATISSAAVMDIVNRTLADVRPKLQGLK